jgi:pimeloyl-ACP methyl ester carboxylesterase
VKVEVNGAEFEVDVAGDGPAVVLLHGWPDSHRLWRAQLPALQAAGFRTIAPDQRGMGESYAPEAVGDYALPTLVGDVVGIMDAVGIERAHVVGHDWGAAVAWGLASFLPDRVDRLVALSVGHPAAFRDAGIEQRQKSWYMLLFQFVGIAEEWISADDFRNFREWANHPDADAVVADLSRPGRLTAGLNWYRANVGPESLLGPPPALPPIAAPTLGVWSSGDRALTEGQMLDSAAYVTGPWRYERIEGSGHWMQLEATDELNALLVDFLEA